ncbi:MAG TPA: hypothetical protein VFF44_13820 [Casimicrobiaceae bacterium]|nr:hypothetical protein [Casimicrobiaceae bacterium]
MSDAVRPRSPELPWAIVAGIAILVGTWLRWYQLPIQVLLDDEWHALHKVIHSDAWGIATSFGFADHSIPLTLYYRWLALHGGLTEWVMHVPLLISGVALLVSVAMSFRRDGETTPAARAAWVTLLAISPLLVYHSRTARPYALTSLLTFVAIVAFRRWWRKERRCTAWGAGYAAATFLSGWLHPITLPFTLLPFAYYGARALLFTQRTPETLVAALRRLLLLGGITVAALAAALGPPLVNDWSRFAAKAGRDAVTLESVYRTLLMLFGIAQPPLLAVLVALSGLGIGRLWQRERDLVAYVLTVTLGAAVAIALAQPQWIHHPGVYARYLLPALPFLLLFLAEGALACLERLRRPAWQAVAMAAAAALLWWAGPMPDYFYRPNQFMGHLRFQYDYDPAHNPYVLEIPRDPVPDFYRQLAQRPPRTLTLIEAPWRLESNFNPHPWYQEIHRQYVKIGLVTPVCGIRDFGEYPATLRALRMRELVHLSEILAGKSYGADYLVMHLKAWKTPPDAEVDWPDVAACLTSIEAKLGAPVYRDDQIVVFALKKPG